MRIWPFVLLYFPVLAAEAQPRLPATLKVKQPVDYVNPFIGASTNAVKAGASHGLGKTFPGAATPFGLVQVSPNTITGGDNGSGYSYEHTSIEGFAFTQLSGVGWYGDLGNFLVMPTTGPLRTNAGTLAAPAGSGAAAGSGAPTEGYRSTYDKSSERATAGYYSVFLSKYHVRTECTAAPHSGMLRFTYEQGGPARIQIDLARRVGGTSTLQEVRVVDDHSIEGWMQCTPDGGGWGDGAGHVYYTVYFHAEFSKPLKDYGVWSAAIPDDWMRKREDVGSDRYQRCIAAATVTRMTAVQQGKHVGFFTEFDTKPGEVVLMKAGISFVDIQGARNNLSSEIADWDFDAVHRQTVDRWSRALGKISVAGGTEEEKAVFYTALYHTMIDPRMLTDVDGRYPGGDGKIHGATAYTRRTVFSGWDVYRSQMPLQTIINPSVVNDMIRSLIDLADESGKQYLERWELMNAYTGCMIGNPAVIMIADAYAKGIRAYDPGKAYRYSVNTCERFGNGDRGWSYICDPDDHSGTSYGSAPFVISNTLENGYSEWCLSRLAAALGHPDDSARYAVRAQSYRNIFDPTVGWFRPRKADGSWEPWPAEGRLKQFYGTVESNPYQQGWFVPHDIPGMVTIMGGREKVVADLQNLFEKTPDGMLWNDYYNHANEPVHHVAFLFNRLGSPWLTQKWSREVCARAYHNGVEGIVGNEDVGQMSAWYVLAASGLHPICPGDTRYEITSPVFSRVVIQLDPTYASGKTFTILARGNSPKNIYIQGATLNGEPYPYCHIDHAQIAAGGTLELIMGPRPDKNWGSDQAHAQAGEAVQADQVHAQAGEATPGDLVHYANTLQGTASDFGLSYGNTYPTTALPFPMNGWSAQTGKDGDGWKYQYMAGKIRAFGETHQCSPWVGDYGVFSLMPVLDSVQTDGDKRATGFSHANEIGEPSYYSVKLDNGIRTEMTPTERGCAMRFSFAGVHGRHAVVLMLDGYTKQSEIHIDAVRRTVSGWVNNGRWTPAGFRNYFVMVFDKPFKAYGTWENVHGTKAEGKIDDQGDGVGAYLEFARGAVVEVKIASSYISGEQALATLQRELPGAFDATHGAADSVWNHLFHRVLVEGGTEAQKATFYSCLFRASLFSHRFFEYDKEGKPYYYSPYDSHIHSGYMYTDNGFWDTFRSQFPLTDILEPGMQGQYMQALLAAQQQCGWLPAWSAPSETGGMLGNHAISLLADAWAKGIRTFDPDSALKAYAHEAMNKGPWGGANGRAGWKEYWELGYVPFPESQGSTAQTQEYAYDDFCAYNLARMTGNNFYRQIFARTMYNYRNVFDTVTGFMRGRQLNGQWTPDFDAYAWGGPYTEGNAWHYNWSVFHDVQGLINLMGGDAKFVAKMDSVFIIPNKIVYGSYGGMIHEMKEMALANMGQYAHGNQPIQHMIYLYSYAGQPWKTQQHIREVMDKLYNATEKGYPGDEDQGGMSSWYVLSAMGIYSVCPGTDQYVLGSPVFNKITITLENGKRFVIEALGNSKDNVYIHRATLNGLPYTHNWITYQDIAAGGVLHLDMSAQPDYQRGTGPDDKPFSVSTSTH